jgi:ATPase family associated with various cellular activities (AAA)
MDDEAPYRAVVEEPPSWIRSGLAADLDWFVKVVEARVKLYFGQDCPYYDIYEIVPPEPDGQTPYDGFVRHYNLTFAERVVFLLGLIPHVKPHLLDLFFVKNSTTGRAFTEFGGREGQTYQGFLPTGETALFILAGDDPDKRLHYSRLFGADHFFAGHDILRIEKPADHEPLLSGFLTIPREIIDLVTTGSVQRPAFSMDFPAKRIETRLDWEDLVLDPYTMEQVLEIKTWVEYGAVLLNDLGLRKRLKPGYRALFFGPSGTGKTLTASLVGKVANRDVYRIDLSMVVSKYIGETEKNIEKVFRKAEHRQWILFFDEADALFCKRTDIRDAHDRYANQEVSYLLQRVDDYEGIVILASNLQSNLDEAFTRRFQSIVHFPMPRRGERQRLWENGFSTRLKPDNSVDLPEIAAAYELSGGAIMNVVRYATLMTLKRGSQTISRDDIIDGIRKELQKEGRTS